MENFQQLVEAVLNTPGETSTALRGRLTQEAVHFIDSGTAQPSQLQEPLSPELERYVGKVARYAYRVTDEDFEQLRQQGYSDEQLFEMTVSVALGAGIHCLSQGLLALKGAEEKCG